MSQMFDWLTLINQSFTGPSQLLILSHQEFVPYSKYFCNEFIIAMNGPFIKIFPFAAIIMVLTLPLDPY